MLRVNQRQLEELRQVFNNIQTMPTKHSIYIVANPEEETNYRRFLCGNLSRKQAKRKEWVINHRTVSNRL